MFDPYRVSWPASRVVEALEIAASHAGLPVLKLAGSAPTWGASELGPKAFDEWVCAGAGWLGIEAEPVEVAHAELDSVLLRAAPALVRLPPDGPLLLIAGRSGRSVNLLTPEFELVRVPVRELRAALARTVEAPVLAEADAFLQGLVDDPKRRARVRDAIVGEVLQNARVTRCYLVRIPPSASFWTQLRFEGVLRRVALLLGAHATQYALMLGAWYTLGSGAFGGGIDRDWLIAWGLILLSAIPVQLLGAWLQGQILRDIGTLLKRRLLLGTLRLDQDALRREGAGQLLGRALDASAVEALALSGGLFAVLALVEFVILAFVVASGPGGAWQAIAFLAWGLATLWMGWRAYASARRWTRARRDMTGDMLEQMVGHRTRLAQQSPARWHDGEDEAFERYLSLSATMDRRDVYLRSMPQGWYLVGLATLLPGLLQGGGSAPGLAVAIGAMLLGGSALARLSSGVTQLGAAACSWTEVEPMFEAAARPEIQPSPDVVASQLMGAGRPAGAGDASADVPVIDASDLVFSYAGRPQPALKDGTLRVELGDRILLEGPSGGGKSTFASLLAGLRQPQAGLLLLEGLDWQTLGPTGWRRRVAAAPQYHDNHVLGDTFLFNLLMGRQWPPSPQDIRDAEDVCRALGLGDLLARMPAGLHQMVGETGWRLSHGERSRLFIARALLQDARVVLLDESFAALDPQTVEQCLRCVFERARALIVIAHP